MGVQVDDWQDDGAGVRVGVRMSDRMRATPDAPWRHCGAGMMSPSFICMGCGKKRMALGSRGTGVRRRCATCLDRLRPGRA